MGKVESVEELARSANGYVDCYVSTEVDEVTEVLLNLGYRIIAKKSTIKRKTLGQLYEDQDHWDLGYDSVIHGKTNLEIDITDIPIDESVERRIHFNFMSMSKFRVYTSCDSNLAKFLIPIIGGLSEQRQNIALVAEPDFYVQLSEFYC